MELHILSACLEKAEYCYAKCWSYARNDSVVCEGSNCFPPPTAAQVCQQERLQAVMLEEPQGTESPFGQLQAAAVGPHP